MQLPGYLQCTTAPSMLLGLGSTKKDNVSLLFSFHLNYFLVPSEHFLQKELSQNFALIPGGPHGTHTAFRFVLVVLMVVNHAPPTPTAPGLSALSAR
jgi:hypothetical protein